MKLYAPSYYKKFKCIADRCSHSCCVGWEIEADEEIIKKYRAMGDEGREFLSHISEDEIGAHISTCQDGRCPFLECNGLCRIISTWGDEYIPEICREHPRFYNRIGDRIELGLGAVCEEACRLILSEDMTDMLCVGERERAAAETDFDTLRHRERIFAVISGAASFHEAFDALAAKYAIPASLLTPSELCECISELEMLREEDRGRFISDSTSPWADGYLRRFLTYLIYRHVSVAESEREIAVRVGFCLLLTRMLEGMLPPDGGLSDVCEAVRVLSEEIEYSEDNTAALIFEVECRA